MERASGDDDDNYASSDRRVFKRLAQPFFMHPDLYSFWISMIENQYNMAVKAGKKYPRNFFSSRRNFWQGPTVQVSQQGRIRRCLDSVGTTAGSGCIQAQIARSSTGL